MSNNTNEEFHEAVASKNWQTFLPFIRQSKKQLNYSHEYIVDQLIKNRWPLTEVVALGQLDLTKLFFEKGDSIGVNDVDRSGWTGLHQAAHHNDIDQMKFLLKHNADPNSMDESHRTPLHSSYYEHYDEDEDHCLILETMKILIDAGARAITTWDSINYLQIESALVEGNLEAVEFVLNLDIDLGGRYYDGDTVLHYLAKNEHSEVFAKIRGRDLDVNARNNDGETPLYFAAQDGIFKAVEFLLSEGADVNVANNHNWTPLRIATKYYEDYGDRNMNCIQLLLQHGADIQVVANENDSSTTIFNTIFEFKDAEDKCTLYKLMLEHLALQEVNGVKIIEIIQDRIDPVDNFFDYCKKLLANKVYDSKTLLELLCCNEEKLIPLMRNADLVRIIESYSDALKSLKVSYGIWLQNRLDKASRTATLRDSAAIVLCKLMKLEYHSYSFIVDSILRYLKNHDLNMILSISF